MIHPKHEGDSTFKTTTKIMLDTENGPAYPVCVNPGASAALGPGTSTCQRRDPVAPPPTPNVNTEQVRLLDAQGAFIRLIDATEAHALIRERRAEGLGNKRTIRAVQLTVTRREVEDKGIPCRPLLPSGLVGQRYSHKHETEKNPENVWTLKRLSSPDAKTDLFVHLAHIDSVLACLNQRERDAMIHGLGLMRGLRAKDLKSFVSSSASTARP